MTTENETPTSTAEAPESTTPQGAADPVEPPQEGEAKPEAKTFTQEELEKVIAKRLAKLERKHQRELENAQRGQTPQPQPEAKKAQEPGKPKPDSFESYTDYLEALTDWKADQIEAGRAKREAEKKEAEEAAKVQQRWNALEEKALERYEDYDEVVDFVSMERRGLINQTIATFALDSDFGPDLLYYLNTNPDEARKIVGLRPTRAAAELGRIEGRLEAQHQPRAESKPKTTTAPAPVTPVGAKGVPAVSDDKLSDADWFAAQRRRR